MRNKLQKTIAAVLLTCASMQAMAQMPTGMPAMGTGATKPGGDASKTGPKPYKDVITSKAITSKG